MVGEAEKNAPATRLQQLCHTHFHFHYPNLHERRAGNESFNLRGIIAAIKIIFKERAQIPVSLRFKVDGQRQFIA
jgi:hypothetical protein